jgi:O-antigen ligase
MTTLTLPVSTFSSFFSVKRQGAPFQPVTPFWLGFWAFALAFSWLLPNHYLPWAAFHADTWVSLILGLGMAGIILRSPAPMMWHWTSLLAAVLVGVPFIQYLFNLLPFVGQAWISSAYLLGFLLALLNGARWESVSPSQLADGLFFSIGVASVLSVGLQLHQWLGLDGLELLSMGLSGTRPYANLGQPNQLGTLLLWGLLACGWGAVTRKIKAPAAILMACYLLFGIALTQSRTAWLGLLLLLVAVWYWRKLWSSKWMPWVVTGLSLYFLLCNLALPLIGDTLQMTGTHNLENRLHGELRPAAWRLFIDAILERPWFGYGLTSVASAQLAVTLQHPSLGVAFGHAHSLILDLMLWFGIPIGLLASTSLAYWFSKCLRSIANGGDAILLMVVVVVGNHAMFELPLHYAYFLLPTGLVIGILNTRISKRVVFRSSRWVLLAILAVSAIVVSLVIHDYFQVEANFYALRFERARVGTLPPGKPPEVLILTQLREEIRYARFEPRGKLSEAELKWMRNAASIRPGPHELHKLATTLALNDHPDEAQLWLKKLCRITSDDQCTVVGKVWAQQSKSESKIAAVKWPN